MDGWKDGWMDGSRMSRSHACKEGCRYLSRWMLWSLSCYSLSGFGYGWICDGHFSITSLILLTLGAMDRYALSFDLGVVLIRWRDRNEFHCFTSMCLCIDVRCESLYLMWNTLDGNVYTCSSTFFHDWYLIIACLRCSTPCNPP